MKFLKTGCFAFMVFCIAPYTAKTQNPVNWTPEQLMQPAALAKTITNHKNVPLIFCVGPGAVIPGSINTGPAHEDAGLAALKKALDTLPKNTAIVIYCGCCPFEHCPNVRPAIAALKDAGFTNYKLLNLEHNIKADWIDKGYPKM
ncbi:MAG TPA: rhodanese-like domain-containing protein [Chitinophagaceae bacterium]|nr:rhodanese-like domain-containing protein [Chitinophagaceae bacterium]